MILRPQNPKSLGLGVYGGLLTPTTSCQTPMLAKMDRQTVWRLGRTAVAGFDGGVRFGRGLLGRPVTPVPVQ